MCRRLNFAGLFSGRTEFDAFHVPFQRVKLCLLLALFLFLSLFPTIVQATEPIPHAWPIEMLDAIGVNESLRGTFEQGEPWDAKTGDKALAMILHRLPEFPLQLCERCAFSWKDKERQAIKTDPGKWQGQFFRLRFQVLTLCKVTLPKEATRRFGFGEYYCLQVDMDGSLATIFARTVPETWKKKLSGEKPVSINEPGGAMAMFLKTGVDSMDDENQAATKFYFAADRIAWYPKTIVGRLGMDVGLFDLVHDRESIDPPEEREAFYQLLATVSREKPGELLTLAKAELGKDQDGHPKWTAAAALFNTPKRMRGKLTLLSGIVRRVSRVEVRDPDIVERFGIRYYYVLWLYTPDSQNNPIIICARNLPQGMPTVSGEDYRESIEVAGFMLKSYKFSSIENVREGKGKRQLAPLLIAREPIWLPKEEPSKSPWVGPIAATVVVFILLLLWYFLRRQAKADRAAAKRRRQNL